MHNDMKMIKKSCTLPQRMCVSMSQLQAVAPVDVELIGNCLFDCIDLCREVKREAMRKRKASRGKKG